MLTIGPTPAIAVVVADIRSAASSLRPRRPASQAWQRRLGIVPAAIRVPPPLRSCLSRSAATGGFSATSSAMPASIIIRPARDGVGHLRRLIRALLVNHASERSSIRTMRTVGSTTTHIRQSDSAAPTTLPRAQNVSDALPERGHTWFTAF
jgi:hypothetical protein